jgi:hypothetical protein
VVKAIGGGYENTKIGGYECVEEEVILFCTTESLAIAYGPMWQRAGTNVLPRRWNASRRDAKCKSQARTVKENSRAREAGGQGN